MKYRYRVPRVTQFVALLDLEQSICVELVKHRFIKQNSRCVTP